MGILVVYFFTVILTQVYFEYLIILLSIYGSKDKNRTNLLAFLSV